MSVNVLLFRGRCTLDRGLKGMLSLFETSDWRHQVIAINQLVDIKPGLLRSPEEQNRERLISAQPLHSLILERFFFCLQVGVIYFWTSFSDYLSLLKSKSVCPCYRSVCRSCTGPIREVPVPQCGLRSALWSGLSWISLQL